MKFFHLCDGFAILSLFIYFSNRKSALADLHLHDRDMWIARQKTNDCDAYTVALLFWFEHSNKAVRSNVIVVVALNAVIVFKLTLSWWFIASSSQRCRNMCRCVKWIDFVCGQCWSSWICFCWFWRCCGTADGQCPRTLSPLVALAIPKMLELRKPQVCLIPVMRQIWRREKHWLFERY